MDCDRIEIARITDFLIVYAILQNDTIAAEIYEDGASLDVPDLAHEYWAAAYVDEKLAGCYRIHSMGAVLWQIHCRILPQYRQKWAEKITRKTLAWAVENIIGLRRVVCFVPACHKNVAMHCKRTGFKRDGLIEASFLRNGQLHDQAIYSIDRNKMHTYKESILCQQQQ